MAKKKAEYDHKLFVTFGGAHQQKKTARIGFSLDRERNGWAEPEGAALADELFTNALLDVRLTFDPAAAEKESGQQFIEGADGGEVKVVTGRAESAGLALRPKVMPGGLAFPYTDEIMLSLCGLGLKAGTLEFTRAGDAKNLEPDDGAGG